jgi:DNA polymerase-3 subunit delta
VQKARDILIDLAESSIYLYHMAKDPVSKLKLEDLYSRIDSGSIDPVYFFSGSEEYLKIEIIKLMRRKLFGTEQATTNVEKITATSGSAAEIIDLMSDYSLFGGGRLVIVSEVQRLSSDGQEALLAVLPSMPPENHLILFGPPSIDRRRKLLKYLTTEATWVSLLPLDERSAPFWIKRRFKSHGMTVSDGAVKGLLRFVGSSYGSLSNQIDKIAIALGEKSRVDEDDIELHTATAAEFDVYRLVDAVMAGDRQRSLEMLSLLLERSDGVGSVLFWLNESFYRHLYVAANSNSMSNGDLARILRMPPFRVQSAKRYVQGKPDDFFRRRIRSIADAEIALRFSNIPQRLIMEGLVVALTGE